MNLFLPTALHIDRCFKKSFGVTIIFSWGVCGGIRSVRANVLVSEFELQPHYYLYFLTNILGKGMDFLILLWNGFIAQSAGTEEYTNCTSAEE